MPECHYGNEEYEELLDLDELQELYKNKDQYRLVPIKKILLELVLCKKNNSQPEFQTYFITDGFFVKIGRAYSVENRLKALQTGNPNRLRIVLTVDSDVENLFHTCFKNYRRVCEWFDLPKGYLDIVIKICEENGLNYKDC